MILNVRIYNQKKLCNEQCTGVQQSVMYKPIPLSFSQPARGRLEASRAKCCIQYCTALGMMKWNKEAH